MIKKVKNTVPQTNRQTDRQTDRHTHTHTHNCWIFLLKELQKPNQEEFRIERVIKKTISYMLSGKAIIIKKIFLYKKNYFSKPCTHIKNKVKVELNLT